MFRSSIKPAHISYYFAIVTSEDKLIYEEDGFLKSSGVDAKALAGGGEAKLKTELIDITKDYRTRNQFVLYSALDTIDRLTQSAPAAAAAGAAAAAAPAISSHALYLKAIDKDASMHISAYVTYGDTRLVLLHDTKSEDAIRNYFCDMHAIYASFLLNPLYKHGSPIISSSFYEKAKRTASRYFDA